MSSNQTKNPLMLIWYRLKNLDDLKDLNQAVSMDDHFPDYPQCYYHWSGNLSCHK